MNLQEFDKVKPSQGYFWGVSGSITFVVVVGTIAFGFKDRVYDQIWVKRVRSKLVLPTEIELSSVEQDTGDRASARTSSERASSRHISSSAVGSLAGMQSTRGNSRTSVSVQLPEYLTSEDPDIQSNSEVAVDIQY